MSKILQEDIESIVSSEIPWLDMKNSSVLITGASGLVGSLIVKSLSAASKRYELNLKIYVVVRNFELAKLVLKDCIVEYIIQDIRDSLNCDKDVDYIIHCAAITKSKEMIAAPVENIQISLYGTDNILKLAKEKRTRSIVYLSSMEVYGFTNPNLESVTEKELGYIDLYNSRSCYPESKRLCENMCYCYFSEYKVPVKVARLAQTFGAGTNINDTRVFGQFARSVISKKDIVLHTDGKSTGNYCYTADTVKGILLVLLKGNNGEAYNIANEDACMTVKQMAELVASKVANGKISVIYEKKDEQSSYGYAPPVKVKLNTDKIRRLGWEPSIGLIDMYKRMIEDSLYDK